MIDIENQLYTAVATAVRATYTDVEFSNTPPLAPSKFPYVSFYEANNHTDESSTDSSLNERAIVLYEVNVFSNKSRSKKTEARGIMAVIDGVMRRYNFVRTDMTPVDNRSDYTIYRLVARYQAKTDGTNMFQN